MLSRSLVAVLLVSLVAGPPLVAPQSAYACSCTPTTLEERVDMAEFALIGTVLEISEVDSAADGGGGEYVFGSYDLTISVEEYLKGSGDATFTIRDGSLSGPACSAFDPDAVGRSYLLFVTTFEGHYRTSSCAGSTAIHPDYAPTVAEEIRQIVAGTALATETPDGGDLAATATAPAADLPPSGAGSSQSDSNRAWLITGVAAAAALGLAGAAAVAWRGARRG